MFILCLFDTQSGVEAILFEYVRPGSFCLAVNQFCGPAVWVQIEVQAFLRSFLPHSRRNCGTDPVDFKAFCFDGCIPPPFLGAKTLLIKKAEKKKNILPEGFCQP